MASLVWLANNNGILNPGQRIRSNDCCNRSPRATPHKMPTSPTNAGCPLVLLGWRPERDDLESTNHDLVFQVDTFFPRLSQLRRR